MGCPPISEVKIWTRLSVLAISTTRSSTGKPVSFGYAKALFQIIEKGGCLEDLEKENEVELMWGDQTCTHLMYYGYADVYILMEPDKNGWQARRVYATSTDQQAELCQRNGHQFLFKIPGLLFEPLDDLFESVVGKIDWSDWTRVYLA